MSGFSWPGSDPHFYPVRIDEDGVAVFSIGQIDVFGDPSLWGLEKFRVVVDRESMEMVSDYKSVAMCSLRPIHRYSRDERFRGVLLELLGFRGVVDDRVVELCEEVDRANVWVEVRRVLKREGYKGYYNRIPTILKRMGMDVCYCDGEALESIFREFSRISRNFDKMVWVGRKYFPNLRWVALKLLELVGAVWAYKVPMILTKRKVKVMEDIWNKIY